MFLGHFSCRTGADGASQEDDVSTGHLALRDQIGKRGPGILIDSLLVWSLVTARPVSAIIDQKQIRAQTVERNELSSDSLLQNVSVAVKRQQDLIGNGRGRDPPGVDLF